MVIRYSKRIQKTGEYIFSRMGRDIQNMRDKGIKVIDFTIGDPRSPTPDFVVDALYEAAKKRRASGYPSYIGDKDFLKTCAAYMEREFGVKLDIDKEICSNIGSKESVFNFPLAFLDQGDIAICPSPGYPPYKTGTEFAGGTPYIVPLLKENNFLIDLDSIPEEIAKRAKIIWINYPNAPTGVSADDDWYKKLINWAQKYEIIIAADEGCYIELYFGKRPKSILEFSRDGIVVFYSLSKRNNMTGYRVGFVAGDHRIMEAYKKIKTNIDSGTPTFIQDVAAVALNETSHVVEMREEYRNKRNLMLKTLSDIGLAEFKGDTTFYIWQEVPAGYNDINFAKKLAEIGIMVTPGSGLANPDHTGYNPGEKYVRIALVPTFEEIEEACERLKSLKF